MAPIVSEVEIGGRADEVFSYVTDPSRFPEWQHGIVSGRMEGDGMHDVGARCVTTRRIGGAERAATSEVTEISPPSRWAVRGLDGPIRAIVTVTVDALNESARSRVTIAVDFEGHGVGKLLVPLVVRRQAAREMPENLQRLKERLESAA